MTKIDPIARNISFLSPQVVYSTLRSVPSCLLESARGPSSIARFSFVAVDPYMVFSIKNGKAKIIRNGEISIYLDDPLPYLRNFLMCYPQSYMPALPPFQGGAIGMFSYDFVRYLEAVPATTIDDLYIPDAHILFFDKVISFDHQEEKAWIIVCPGVRNADPFSLREICIDDKIIHEAEMEAERIAELLTKSRSNYISTTCVDHIKVRPETSINEYVTMVKRAKDYISAGDIYQANLSLRISAEIRGVNPWDIYVNLTKINPSPFAGFIDFGEYQIVSSSPERLVRVYDNLIDTRPIAGTRPRGRDSIEDMNMRQELLLNEKERAEHIMLIDLERNDIGKIAQFGTVEVDELMTTEAYSHVIHIVSNVKGKLLKGNDVIDAVRALFPGGTITGVPKVRCMEIIDELEKTRRGPYTGSIGYIGFNGNMDLNIIIRTFLIKNKIAYVQAGAGIVADSDPEKEYVESLNKAEALVRTLENL